MEQMLNNAARESQANQWTIRLKVLGVILLVCLVSSSLDLSGFSREWHPLGVASAFVVTGDDCDLINFFRGSIVRAK